MVIQNVKHIITSTLLPTQRLKVITSYVSSGRFSKKGKLYGIEVEFLKLKEKILGRGKESFTHKDDPMFTLNTTTPFS